VTFFKNAFGTTRRCFGISKNTSIASTTDPYALADRVQRLFAQFSKNIL
jgi:hypothetical protein